MVKWWNRNETKTENEISLVINGSNFFQNTAQNKAFLNINIGQFSTHARQPISRPCRQIVYFKCCMLWRPYTARWPPLLNCEDIIRNLNHSMTPGPVPTSSDLQWDTFVHVRYVLLRVQILHRISILYMWPEKSDFSIAAKSVWDR